MGSILFVAGARPNFMKIAPIIKALESRSGSPRAGLVHTGQHYDFEMSGVFFEQLGLREPDFRLGIGSASHGVQTGRIMAAFDELIAAESVRPRAIVVVGDVNSTMACALVGVKAGIPVAHVEAGLRSFDRSMPEEINRVVTDSVADLLLVSEPAGLANLAREGIPDARVRYCGNVMIDSLIAQLDAARELAMSTRMKLEKSEYAVVTLHRPANVDDPRRLAALVELVRKLAAQLPVVFPVHPRTETRLAQLGLDRALAAEPRVRLTAALGYREFLSLMDSARVVVTDSGGIQEETTYLGIPCVTMRTTTERPITVSHGTNHLVGDDLDAAWQAIAAALSAAPRPLQRIEGWDGRAATRVADALIEAWGRP